MLFNVATLLATASFALALPTAAPPPTGGVDANATAPPPAYVPLSDFDFQSLNLALNQEWIELDLFNYGLSRFSDAEFEEYGITAPPPAYVPLSDFDFQSLNLALNQEWIELDLFNYGLSRFSDAEFEEYGITAPDRSFIQFMAQQEIGHSTMLTNILSGYATPAKQCKYRYEFETVPEFIQFCAVLTRWGESGVYGFLSHLDSRASATLLVQSIATEARQQMAFRQLAGAHPMPVWFETGISQSQSWTLLSKYLIECPAENPRIEWNIFPELTIDNNPNLTAPGIPAALSTNRTAFTSANETLYLSFDAPGKNVSYNGSYVTAVGTNVTDLIPKFCAFVSQLNATNTPYTATTNNTGTCEIPSGVVFGDDAIVNGTMFLMLLSEDTYVTPYNESLLDAVIIAGPAVLIAG